MFSASTVPPDSKETQLGSIHLEVSPSAGKNTCVVSVSYHAWKCACTAISGGGDISEVPGCHLLRQLSSQWGSLKLLQGLVSHELSLPSALKLFLIQWNGHIIKVRKPDNFESHNSLKLLSKTLPIFEVFVLMSLDIDLSLNQALQIFLLYVR